MKKEFSPTTNETKSKSGTVHPGLQANGTVKLKHILSGEEKQAILAAIVDSSEDAIISKTLDGLITSWNKTAKKMFGYTEKEVLGKHISIIIPPERIKEETLILNRIRSGKRIDHFETIRIAKDGSERNISLTISPVKNQEGVIIGASKVARDISFKKQALVKQAMLAAIVDFSDDAIISKTLKGIITSWNHAATTMFGYTEKEITGKHISIIIPEDRLEEETLIIESISLGKKIDHFETVRIGKDGKETQISLTVSPIKDLNGKIIGASKVARDISLKVAAEKQRDLYTQKLKDLNTYKDEFMVMASHELKTPLTVIFANLQLLQLLLPRNEHINFLDTSVKQVKKLTGLVNNLLDVSKVQAGKLTLNKTDFCLHSLLKETGKNLQQTTEKHRIIFKDPQNKIIIHADRERIEQVMVNLISNAIKYMPAGGDIYVEAYKEGENVLVRVADNGIGIPEPDLEYIFQRFYRVSSHASSFSGSGVGLFISAEIIKAHEGRIWVTSEINKGSEFNFSIPITN